MNGPRKRSRLPALRQHKAFWARPWRLCLAALPRRTGLRSLTIVRLACPTGSTGPESFPLGNVSSIRVHPHIFEIHPAVRSDQVERDLLLFQEVDEKLG